MKRKRKKNANSTKLILIFSFVTYCILVISLISSVIFSNLGDLYAEKEDFVQSEKFYYAAKTLNPFDTESEKKILGVKIIEDHLKTPSEENSEVANGNDNNRELVLGASVKVPVLMYHYIRINPNPNDKVGFGLSVTPSNFDAQMKYLSEHGYHTITLDELGQALLQKTPLPQKAIVITFDDGYRDAYTQAYPILKKYGLKAINFVITGVIGTPWYLTWDQINEMGSSGVFTFGAHTVHHYALTYVNDKVLSNELSQSKQDLEKHVGYFVNWLAYPFGNVNERVVRATAKAGYLGAFGTNFGVFQSSDYMFTLPRVRVGGGMNVESFAARIL